jgi:hypothetical protein
MCDVMLEHEIGDIARWAGARNENTFSEKNIGNDSSLIERQVIASDGNIVE